MTTCFLWYYNINVAKWSFLKQCLQHKLHYLPFILLLIYEVNSDYQSIFTARRSVSFLPQQQAESVSGGEQRQHPLGRLSPFGHQALEHSRRKPETTNRVLPHANVGPLCSSRSIAKSDRNKLLHHLQALAIYFQLSDLFFSSPAVVRQNEVTLLTLK